MPGTDPYYSTIDKEASLTTALSLNALKCMRLMEIEFPDERIDQAMIIFDSLGNVAKIGFKSALANCGCYICREILGRIKYGDLQ